MILDVNCLLRSLGAWRLGTITEKAQEGVRESFFFFFGEAFNTTRDGSQGGFPSFVRLEWKRPVF